MKIVTLVENTAGQKDLKCKHGLSLYIETEQHKILFDVGPDDTFLKNAQKLGIDIKAVDIVIISHGHSDHGGGLNKFFQVNHTAKVYMHPDALTPHYNKVLRVPVFCGLDSKFQKYKQMVFTGERYIIDKNLILFADVKGHKCIPTFNRTLFEQRGRQKVEDEFTHEQSLIIQEGGKVILIGGCAHRGIVNIMKQACLITGKYLDVVVSGFHLIDPVLKKTETKEFLDKLAYNLEKYSCPLYTMHCTGTDAYAYLHEKLGDRLQYLSVGDTLEL